MKPIILISAVLLSTVHAAQDPQDPSGEQDREDKYQIDTISYEELHSYCKDRELLSSVTPDRKKAETLLEELQKLDERIKEVVLLVLQKRMFEAVKMNDETRDKRFDDSIHKFDDSPPKGKNERLKSFVQMIYPVICKGVEKAFGRVPNPRDAAPQCTEDFCLRLQNADF